MSNHCPYCESKYYVGRKYHHQLVKIFWRLEKYLLTQLSIPDIHNLEDEIVKLEQIYEGVEL